MLTTKVATLDSGQPWVPHSDKASQPRSSVMHGNRGHVSPSSSLKLHGLTGAGFITATGATGCGICRGWVTAFGCFIIWAISGWLCFSRRILVISRVKAAGSSTSAFASASGLSRTMAMSISPPSLWTMVGPPACTSARIATALFSHKVRFPFL